MKIVFVISIMLLSQYISIAQQAFDKSKDLLLVQYDLRPDEDDVHSAAAFGCMLHHNDMAEVKYYVVAGSYGRQTGPFINSALPGFFNSLFGKQDSTWTDAYHQRTASAKRVAQKIEATLQQDGNVFIAESGQSDFTYDVLHLLLNGGIRPSILKSKVIVVQHSYRNEMNDMSTPEKLKWVKQHTHYVHIDDGNRADNRTPGYMSDHPKFLEQAISQENPNKIAQQYWVKAASICEDFESTYENPHIANGGIDFSDHSEIWWILNQGDTAKTTTRFWSRYVTNSTDKIKRPTAHVANTNTYALTNEWQPLLDANLSCWENYLSFQFQNAYNGSEPLDKNGKPKNPIGMHADTFGVFTTQSVNGEPILRISGEYYGCLISKENYKNYHLRLKVKWGTKKWPPRAELGYDSGLLYHSIGKPGVDYWRTWMLSQEFQIVEGGMGDYWCQASSAIDIRAKYDSEKGKAMANHSEPFLPFARKSEYGFHCARSKNAELQVGEWNTLDLICFEDKAFHIVNGVLVMILENSRYYKNGKSIQLHEGKLQIQSEAAEVFFKDIKIKSIENISDIKTYCKSIARDNE